MKSNVLIGIIFYLSLLACDTKDNNMRVIFFLHNRFLETHQLSDSHPEFGRTEYNEIISEFKKTV